MECVSTPARGSPVSEGGLRAEPDSSSTVLNSVLRLIENHLSGESEKPLVVHLPDHFRRCPALQEALRGVSFEFEDEVLDIPAMPGYLHVTCTTWFTKTHFQRVLPMLTPRELDGDFLDLETREVGLASLRAANNFTGGFKQGIKISDGAIVFNQDGKCPQERVVLETGFSQDLEGLRKDRDDWLYRSSTVMLVFLINIEEDCSALRRYQKSEDFQARLHDMTARFVCQAGISSGDDSDENDARTTRILNDAVEGIAQDVLVDDWLGPLNVHLEAWERVENGCRLRGAPVQLIPVLDAPVPPEIKITDLIPSEHRDPVADDSRATTPNFEGLRQRILNAMRTQAISRAVGRVRKSKT